MIPTHGPLLSLILPYLYSSSVSTSLVGHVLYSADLISAIHLSPLYLMVHRYILSYISYTLPIVLFSFFLYSHLILKSLLEYYNLKVVTFGKASITHLATGRIAT